MWIGQMPRGIGVESSAYKAGWPTARSLLAAILLASALLCAGRIVAVAEPGANVPVAVAARLTESDGVAKLVFDLSGPVEGRSFAMADPDRIVIDIPEVNFQVDPAVGRAAQGKALGSLVRSFRFGLLGAGKSRIVIDLAAPARVERLTTSAVAKGAQPARLEIDLKRCEPAVFHELVTEAGLAPAAPPPASPPVSDGASGLPVIVLDPGHGGIDGGAYGPQGVVEKAIVFDFSRELAEKLGARHRFKIVMTRNGDDFVSLDDRVRIAEDAQASLFISIHADSLVEAVDVSGATVYTLADKASDAEAARVAEHENAADKTAGVEPSPDQAGVADILFDLKRRETRAYAHMFSR